MDLSVEEKLQRLNQEDFWHSDMRDEHLIKFRYGRRHDFAIYLFEMFTCFFHRFRFRIRSSTSEEVRRRIC